ncbi:hypothetical protein [Clostridium fallax]|uniref:TRASH domain-containing protein n=1 Tax=Clostridium fallax TaxID=1533 RepID=A0A1M4SJM7_9CLOT|nr:hypothetical protein [Clostridium fallax]SHE32358.1 hypothetical protein SAMN05443638_10156 [Clostridium fallax]SQB07857.1 Uncharacterised protein [Clostridium fallax]
MVDKCLYCHKTLNKDSYYENKVGKFCSEDHWNKYYNSLSKEDLIELQNSFCVCSDD